MNEVLVTSATFAVKVVEMVLDIVNFQFVEQSQLAAYKTAALQRFAGHEAVEQHMNVDVPFVNQFVAVDFDVVILKN